MDVFGGNDTDSFYVGQMYNDNRTEEYGVSTADPISTTLTTKGYLSDGCNHPVTINGGYGGGKLQFRMSCWLIQVHQVSQNTHACVPHEQISSMYSATNAY